MYDEKESLFWAKEKSSITYRLCTSFFYMLRETQIPYVVVKGEPLSVQAFGSAGHRISKDIDILTSRNNLDVVKNLLKENGFHSKELDRSDEVLMLSASHQTSPWRKEASFGQINIDLNFDLFWGEYSGKRISVEEFIKDPIEMDIYGQKIKALPPLKAMVQLILHHYKEMNSLYHLTRHDRIKRSMFQDVYYLWKNNQRNISFERLTEIITKYDIAPYAFYILFFTNMIYQDKELNEYVEAFRSAEGEMLLDYYGLAKNERKKWKVDFWTRLETNDLYTLIRDELTEENMKKLEENQRIFS